MRAHHITGVAHRAHQRALGVELDFLAQLGDVHVDHVGLRVEVVVPDRFEQHRACHHLVGVPHQVLEQLELARLQVDGAAGARHAPRQQVHAQIAHLEYALAGVPALAAAGERIDPRQQLAEGERLGEVVVAAGAQTLDALVDRIERGEDQDGRAAARLAQRLDDAESVDVSRQHTIHDDDIVGLAGREKQAVPPVGGVLDRVTGLPQPVGDEARHALVVLDDQDLQGATPALSGAPSCPEAAGSWCGCLRAQRTVRRSRYR
jgi:hypothetical protein